MDVVPEKEFTTGDNQYGAIAGVMSIIFKFAL